ncbi:ABC transporter permease [Marinobacterium nitratireducens]|uniref:ABC transporter permease n=1 Tax=Marinobacterium nitratireducens TaxID=518897 RepID=A0A918DUX5_9GAMM|nr:ABC transporter permease [Marinobacterium nitratireducens]GGO84229.1 ABC transporter permease [Marinobacterium nitratireducens]
MTTMTVTAPPLKSRLRLPLLIWLSLGWLALMLLVAVSGDLWVPFDYQGIDLRARLQPPAWLEGGNWHHPFGTDHLGRDVLSRLVTSIQISLLVALIGTLIGALLGTLLGLLAAHFRGWVDDLVMIAIDYQASIPFMILALAVVAFFSNSLVLFVLLMGIFGWERYARISRGLALSSVRQGYAVAVRTLGASPWRIYSRHILPNIANALIVNMTLNFPQTIMLETSLSFLGLGIQPPMTSLGNMVGFGRDYLLTAWWLASIPALVIFFTTLAFALLGDWVRDKLDPTSR